MAREVLTDRRTRERGIIDTAAVSQLLDDHRRGQCAGGDVVWALLNLELWYRTFIDGDGIQTLPAPATSQPCARDESPTTSTHHVMN